MDHSLVVGIMFVLLGQFTPVVSVWKRANFAEPDGIKTLAPERVEVVLAHYDEDVSWIRKYQRPDLMFTIYSKGKNPPPSAVEILPNVGRESHTFLHHIIKNYEKLADWTVFSQAAEPGFGFRGGDRSSGHLIDGVIFEDYLAPFPDGKDSLFILSSAATFPEGMQSSRLDLFLRNVSSTKGTQCPLSQEKGWSPWWIDKNHPHVTLFKSTQPNAPTPIEFYQRYVAPGAIDTPQSLTLVFSCGARFSVSRERILRHPIGYYKRLLAQVSKHKNPIQGFYLEAMWYDIFHPESLQSEKGPVCKMADPPNKAVSFNRMHEIVASTIQNSLIAVNADGDQDSTDLHFKYVEVVLAQYDEDVSWIRKYQRPDLMFTIYSKGKNPPPSAVEILPNVGRESHTFLHHIIKNYEKLADWTVFSQAAEPGFGFRGGDRSSGHLIDGVIFEDYLAPFPDGKDSLFILSSAATFPEGMQSSRLDLFLRNVSSTKGTQCPLSQEKGWSPWWIDKNHPHVTLFKSTQPNAPTPIEFYQRYVAPGAIDTPQSLTLVFSCGARFSVSRERILRHPIGYYKRLLAQVSKHKNPIQGFYLEAMWYDIFHPESLQSEKGPVCKMADPPNKAVSFNRMHEIVASTIQNSLIAVNADGDQDSTDLHFKYVEVVLAQYDEDVSWIRKYQRPDLMFTIYSKGKNPPPSAVEILPNVGRESHTFLHHIIKNYEKLADWTVFSQAAEPGFGFRGGDRSSGHLIDGVIFEDYLAPFPDGKDSLFILSSAATFPEGMQSSRLDLFLRNVSSTKGTQCPLSQEKGWSPWWIDKNHPHVTLFKSTQPNAPTPIEFYQRYVAPGAIDTPQSLTLVFSCGARFSVSRERILRHPIGYYKRLLAQVSKHKNPIQGFYLEAMWYDIFHPESLQSEKGPVCKMADPPTEALSIDQMYKVLDDEIRQGFKGTSLNQKD